MHQLRRGQCAAFRLARVARAAIPPTEGHVRLRDAHAWAQQPQQGIEKFAAVVIPTAGEFDALAQLYAEAGSEVSRSDIAKPADADPDTKPRAKRKE